jgi:DNA/RNA-binding domain of Phe-tRNA-synthetase-like protein
MYLPEIIKDSSLEKKVSLGILIFDQLSCLKKENRLWSELESLAQKYHQYYASPSDALDKLQPARKLYRSIGIEPTRTRPSSEALFRRAVTGKSLYQVNSIVDVCNLSSLYFLLPIGLYDVAKITGNIIIRLGQAGEFYSGIGKDRINVENRLCLADQKGPFGNPSSDSLRTSIDLKSQRVCLVIFAPGDYPDDLLEAHLQFAENKMLIYHPSGLVMQKIRL